MEFDTENSVSSACKYSKIVRQFQRVLPRNDPYTGAYSVTSGLLTERDGSWQRLGGKRRERKRLSRYGAGLMKSIVLGPLFVVQSPAAGRIDIEDALHSDLGSDCMWPARATISLLLRWSVECGSASRRDTLGMRVHPTTVTHWGPLPTLMIDLYISLSIRKMQTIDTNNND